MSIYDVVQIKIFSKEDAKIKTMDSFELVWSDFCINPNEFRFNVHPSIINEIDDYLTDLGYETSSGIMGGCYGARDGKQYEGLTAWIDALDLPERWLDSDGDEIVNLAHLLDDNLELVKNVDADNLLDVFYEVGIDSKSNNTYNYEGDSETPYMLFGANYDVVELGDKTCLIIKFHLGGDPRGNYTKHYLFKTEHIDDIYSVIYPYKTLDTDDAA